MIKNESPKSFYNTFERKGSGQKTTHYCPGCGHGTIHKLIAEAMDILDIRDRTIFCNPVGCAVVLYYYIDAGQVQCPHGRAPAVSTGIKRSLDDSVVVSYQGDGDLAGIGMSEIIHAANRGEKIAVFFVNNAIYGMTGGQMAPTTLIGQESKTTPFGRDAIRDGMPVRMSEMIATLDAPVYVERCSVSNPANVMKTRKAINKALQIQKDKKGFAFVEILSPCPINWKMDPNEAREWMIEKLEKFYPVKIFKDNVSEEKPTGRMPLLNDEELLNLLEIEDVKDNRNIPAQIDIGEHKVKIAGFGGQGIISVGVLLSTCATIANYNTTWIPSYGAEMRGGTAYSSVVISNDTIGSPVVNNPNTLIAMNAPSLDAFENSVLTGGTIIVNSSIVSRKVERTDVNVYYVPATEMANEIGQTAVAAVIALSFFAKVSGFIDTDIVKKAIPVSLKNAKFIEANNKAIESAENFFKEYKK